MLALCILGGILLLLFLLLLPAVRVTLSCRAGQFAVRVRYLCVSVTLFPRPEPDPDAPAKPRKEKKPKPEKEKLPEEKRTLRQQWNRLKPLLRASKRALARLLRHITFDRIKGTIVVARADAHETALAYARSAALLSALLGLLGALFTVKKPALTLTPGFAAAKSDIDISLRVSLRPVFAVAAGLRFLGAFLRFRKRPKRRGKPPSAGPAGHRAA